MCRKNSGEMRAWTHFACALALCLIALLVAAHFIGPRLVQLSARLPTQTLRAQIRLLQDRTRHQNPTDVIILGDSTASRSLIASRIEKKLNDSSHSGSVLSLAVSYGTLANSYTLLLRFLDKNPLPRCVVVMTSYGAARQHYGETFWEMMVDPNLFSYDELLALYEWSQEAGDFPSTAYGLTEYKFKVAERMLLNGFSLYLLRNALFNWRSAEKSARFFDQAFNENGSFSVPRSHRFHRDPGFHAYLTRPYQTEPLIDLVFKKIADLKTHVLILSTPLSEDFNTLDVKRWTKSHEAHVLELLSTYKNVSFSMIPRALPGSYFLDPTHLIADGAEQLEDAYVADIQQCLNQ